MVVSDGALWVTNYDEGTVSRITTAGLGEPASPTTIEVGDGPIDVAAGEDGIWVANQLGRSVTRIDPASGEVVATTVGTYQLRRLG